MNVISSSHFDFQYPNPFRDDVKFEEFVVDLFNADGNTDTYHRMGRPGQDQFGIDVVSFTQKTAIQCKLKAIDREDSKIVKELIAEFDRDFEKFRQYSKNSGIPFARYLFVSTFKGDSKLDEHCIKRSTKELVVEYWSWERLLSRLSPTATEKYFKTFSDIIQTYYSGVPEIDISDATAGIIDSSNILDQLHQFVELFYKELGFIPIHLLKRMYPFRIRKEKSYAYYGTFTLHTNNEKLFEFFQSLEIDGAAVKFNDQNLIVGIEDYGEKTKNTLRRLSRNLVFNIQSEESGKAVDIRYAEIEKCGCISCAFMRGDHLDVLQKINQRHEDLHEQLKTAFINHKIGNNRVAAEILKEIAEKAKANGFETLYFISQFNLSKLKTFIDGWSYGNTSLVNELAKINLDHEFAKSHNSFNKPILKWIKEQGFFNEAFQAVQAITLKLRNRFDDSLRGGWSSNSDVWELMNEFAELESFLSQNHIVYDEFAEFGRLANAFIEGLFASHGIPPSQGTRLEVFDDWLIQCILLHGDAEEILKCYSRYGLNGITYIKSSKEGDSLIERVFKFTNTYDQVRDGLKDAGIEHGRFIDHYSGYFDRAVIMCALCNLEKEDILQVANWLVDFLKAQDHQRLIRQQNLWSFIRHQGKFFEEETFLSFIELGFSSTFFLREDFFDAVVDEAVKQKAPLKFSTTIMESITDFIANIKAGKHGHDPEILLHIYRITDAQKVRIQIAECLEYTLSKSFRSHLYYLAVFDDVLGIDCPFFDRLIEGSIPPKEPVMNPFSGLTSSNNINLDMLIDIGYKQQLDFREPRFQGLWGIQDYYDWLLDMTGFDYQKFDPYWVTRCRGSLKFEMMRRHPEVSEAICRVLRTTRDHHLKEALTQIQCARSS